MNQENKSKRKSRKTVAEDRTIAGYPPKETCKDVDYYCEQTKDSKSYLVTIALQQFFRRNPQYVHPDNRK